MRRMPKAWAGALRTISKGGVSQEVLAGGQPLSSDLLYLDDTDECDA